MAGPEPTEPQAIMVPFQSNFCVGKIMAAPRRLLNDSLLPLHGKMRNSQSILRRADRLARRRPPSAAKTGFNFGLRLLSPAVRQ